MTAAEATTLVLFMLVGGVIADRLPRFLVMVAADLGAAAAWGALAVMLITGWAPLGLLIAAAGFAGMATALFYPALTGVVPEVVPEAQLQSANGVLRLGQVGRRNAPQLVGTHARRKSAGQFGTVDQPLGLGEAADDGGGEEHQDFQG